MQPLTRAESRLLERLERGLVLRLLLGPVIGALAGLVFAVLLASAAGPSGRFTLGDQSPAYAALEAAIGWRAAFVVLCAVAFAGLGLFLTAIIGIGLTRVRAQLRERRDAAGVEDRRM